MKSIKDYLDQYKKITETTETTERPKTLGDSLAGYFENYRQKKAASDADPDAVINKINAEREEKKRKITEQAARSLESRYVDWNDRYTSFMSGYKSATKHYRSGDQIEELENQRLQLLSDGDSILEDLENNAFDADVRKMLSNDVSSKLAYFSEDRKQQFATDEVKAAKPGTKNGVKSVMMKQAVRAANEDGANTIDKNLSSLREYYGQFTGQRDINIRTQLFNTYKGQNATSLERKIANEQDDYTDEQKKYAGELLELKKAEEFTEEQGIKGVTSSAISYAESDTEEFQKYTGYAISYLLKNDSNEDIEQSYDYVIAELQKVADKPRDVMSEEEYALREELQYLYTGSATEYDENGELVPKYDWVKRNSMTGEWGNDPDLANKRMAEIESQLERFDNIENDNAQYAANVITFLQKSKYDRYRNNEDFEEKSDYEQKVDDNPFDRIYGFDNTPLNLSEDEKYELVNGKLDGVEAERQLQDMQYLERMTAGEIQVYNYLYSDSPEEAEEYLSIITDMSGGLKDRYMNKVQTDASTFSANHPFLGAVGNLAVSIYKPAVYGQQWYDYITDGKIDESAMYNAPIYASRGLDAGVEYQIEKNWGEPASFAYKVGESIAQSAMFAWITGGSSLLASSLMGAGAAAEKTVEAKERGLNDSHALALGTMTGLAEVVTEKYEIDGLLDKALKGEDGLRYFLKNSFTEAFGEGASSAAGIVSDIIISQDKSEWNTAIKHYMENEKCNENEAFINAFWDQAQAIGLDSLAGLLAGGTHSALNIGVTKLNNAFSDRTDIGDDASDIEPMLDKPDVDVPEIYGDEVNADEPAKSETDVQQVSGAEEQTAGEISDELAGDDILQGDTEKDVTPSDEVTVTEGQAQKGEVQSSESAAAQNDVDGVEAVVEELGTANELGEVQTSSAVIEEQSGAAEKNEEMISSSTATRSPSGGWAPNGVPDTSKVSDGDVGSGEGKTVDEIDSMAELKEISKEGNTRVLAESEDSPLSITISKENGKTWYTLNVNGVAQKTAINIRAAVSYYNDAAFEYNADHVELNGEDYIDDDDFGYESDLYAVEDEGNVVQHSVSNEQTPSTVTESRSPYPKGQVQRNASLQARIAAMESTTDAATVERARAESDLTVKTGILAGASEENIRIARELGNAVGRKIVFYNDTTTVNGKMEHGYYAGNGVLFINVAAGDVVSNTVAHELTHSIEGTKAYDKLVSYIELKLKREGTSLDAMADEMMELYKEGGEELTPEGAQQEAVARFVEQRLLTDEASIKELANIRRSVAQRFFRFFNSVLAKLKNKKASEWMQIAEMRNIYAEALGQSREVIRNEQGDREWQSKLEFAGESQVKKISGDRTDDDRRAGEGLADFVESVSNMLDKSAISKRKYRIGKLSDSHKRVIEDALRTIMPKFSADGYELWIDGTGAQHIEERHGENGKADQTMASRENKELIPWVTNAPDGGELMRNEKGELELSNRYFNPDNSKAPQIRIYKAVDGNTIYVSECVPDSKNKRVYITSAYIKSSTNQLLNIDSNESPQPTSETSFDSSATSNSIPDSAEKSNTSAEKSSADETTTRHQSSIKPVEGAENVQEQTAESKAEPVKVAELPPKAHAFYVSAVNKFVNTVTRQFGVPEFECGAYLRNAVEQLMQGHLDDGKTYDARKVFDKLYKGAVNQAMKQNELHRKVYDLLNNREVLISDSAVEELGKKAYRESKWIHGDATDGVAVSEVYAELTAIAPELFPTKITSPAKQLEHMYRVIPQIENATRTVNNAYSEKADIFRDWAFEQFQKDFDALQSSFKEIKRYSAEQVTKTAAKKKAPEPLQEDTVKVAYEQKRKARERINNIYNNALLSDADKGAVQRVLDGEITLDALNGDAVSLQNVKNLVEAVNDYRSISERLDEYNSKRLDKVIEQKKEQGGVDFDKDEALAFMDTLNVKAKRYLAGAQDQFTKKTKRVLGMMSTVNRMRFDRLVDELALEYYATGTVSEKSKSDLFEWAYDFSTEINEEMYQRYRQVRKYLRNTKITLSEDARSGVGDYKFFRNRNYRLLYLVEEGGLGVEHAYEELRDMAPELFPAELTNPANQALQMSAVSQELRMVECTLEDYQSSGAKVKKAVARNDFDVSVNMLMSELHKVKRYADSKAKAGEDFSDLEKIEPQDIRDAYEKMKKARGKYERVAAKHLLTDYDNVQVGRILRKEIYLEHLDPKKCNYAGIKAVVEAKAEYEVLSRFIAEYKRKRKAALYAYVDELLKTVQTWKDKPAGLLYARETMERNIRDIVPVPELAQEIIDEFFTPVHTAQAEATKMKNTYRDRVRALELKRKPMRGDKVSESYAVQLYGEAMDNIRIIEESQGRIEVRDSKTYEEWQAVIDEMWSSSPGLDKVKIENAVKEFRAIYNELLEQMNEVRVRNGYEPISYRSGYFPHFQPGETGLLATIGKAFGINGDVTALPTTINGMTHVFHPGIQWFGHAQERKNSETAYDAVEGFDQYIEGAADIIFQTDNIQKLRALSNRIRYQASTDALKLQEDIIRSDESKSDNEKQTLIDELYKGTKYKMSYFVAALDEYTNLLANKKSHADRQMEQDFGRCLYNIMRKVMGRVAANMVAVNPASWLTNFIPLTQGWSHVSSANMLNGMQKTLAAMYKDDGIVEMSAFLTNRKGSDPIVKSWSEKWGGKFSAPMEYIDQFVAGSLVRARYRQNLQQGMSEAAAIADADAFAAGVMADRSKGGMPTVFARMNPGTKVFTQFQLEVNNQLSYLFKDMPRAAHQRDEWGKALAMMLFKFFLGAWIYNELYEYLIGRRPALDVIGMANESFGDFAGYQLPNMFEAVATRNIPNSFSDLEVEKKDRSEAIINLFGNIAQEIPIISIIADGGRVPVMSSFIDVGAVVEALTSDDEDLSGEKRRDTILKELGNGFFYSILPFGGSAIRKGIDGYWAVRNGGSYTKDKEGNDKLQYPIHDDSLGTYLRAMLFGKTTLPEGQEWIESGFKGFGVKQTKVYKSMLEEGADSKASYNMIKEMVAVPGEGEGQEAKKRTILLESDVSGEGKFAAYKLMFTGEGESDLMERLEKDGVDKGEAVKVLIGIKNTDDLRKSEKSNAQRAAIAESTLTEKQKKMIYRSRLSEDHDDRIEALEGVGLSFDDFLKVQSAYATFKDEQETATGQALEFSMWVDDNYSGKQASVIRENFKYFIQSPVDAGVYDDFAGAGVSKDAAHKLHVAFDALEPENGRDKVSSLQQYRAILACNLSETDTAVAMDEIMTSTDREKYGVAQRYGFSLVEFVEFKELMEVSNADGKGSVKKDEATAALKKMKISNEERAVLWQLAGKWKGKNNPFDAELGAQVYTALYGDE